ncbi:MAG: hypothetical protein WB441_00720 [Nocardioidaceae bacterium]
MAGLRGMLNRVMGGGRGSGVHTGGRPAGGGLGAAAGSGRRAGGHGGADEALGRGLRRFLRRR